MPRRSVRTLYRWATRSARRFGPRFARRGSKLALGFAGRAEAPARLVEWGRASRDPDRPLLWFHAPSVGEGLQAQAVIEAYRERRDAQIVFTHFSPSAEGLARRIGADVAAYLPWDLPEVLGPVLDALRPEVVVFTKTEVWPVLAAESRRRGAVVALVAGTVPPGAGRMRWPARMLLGSTWRGLGLACAIAEEDGQRLVALGVRADTVHSTGDPGIDSAAGRAAGADPGAPHLDPFLADPAPTLVAGSTWPSGEAVLLPALERLRPTVPRLRLVVAPHEPTAPHVEALLTGLTAVGWTSERLSDVVARGALDGADAVVVDSVGILAHLYTVGDVAYVGGGFHGQGLHSVLEPAAAGVPVVFGPRHGNARAAADLVTAGGAKIAADTEEMERTLSHWLADEADRRAAGRRAFAYIDRHRGAAVRTAELLETLVP